MAYGGQIIGGKYRIISLIDEGGMSRVYLADDAGLGKEWAVKEILKCKDGRDNSVGVEAAMREARIIKDLDHHCIVRIVDIIDTSEAVYIVEDLVRGVSLGEMIRNAGKITEEDILAWAGEMCSVLDYLHTRDPRIIYRDLKPDNIILTKSGHIKLIDFGIARQYKPEKDRDTECLGTAQFAAPEQYEDFGTQTDEKTDIYGLGCTMICLANACGSISHPLKKVIRKCTMTMPEDRYNSAAQVMADLEKLLRRAREKTAAPISMKEPFSAKALPVAAMLVVIAALAVSSFVLKGTQAGSGSSADTVQELFLGLEKTVDSLSGETDPEQMIRTCGEVVEALLVNADAFRKGGIEEGRINKLTDSLYEAAADLKDRGTGGDEEKGLLEKTEYLMVTVRKVYEEDAR